MRQETEMRATKQEAGLVHQEFLSFIGWILFSFFPLSASKDKEDSIPKISKRQWTEETQNCGTVLPDRLFFFLVGRE